jgi:rubrerythrin
VGKFADALEKLADDIVAEEKRAGLRCQHCGYLKTDGHYPTCPNRDGTFDIKGCS